MTRLRISNGGDGQRRRVARRERSLPRGERRVELGSGVVRGGRGRVLGLERGADVFRAWSMWCSVPCVQNSITICSLVSSMKESK